MEIASGIHRIHCAFDTSVLIYLLVGSGFAVGGHRLCPQPSAGDSPYMASIGFNRSS